MTVYRLDTRRPAGLDQQGRHAARQWLDTVPTDSADQHCAPEGGKHADPVPSGSVLSMRRHRRTRASVALAIALAVVSYALHLVWPQMPI